MRDRLFSRSPNLSGSRRGIDTRPEPVSRKALITQAVCLATANTRQTRWHCCLLRCCIMPWRARRNAREPPRMAPLPSSGPLLEAGMVCGKGEPLT